MKFSAQAVVLLLVLVASGTWAVAQAVQPKPVLPFPRVFSGADIGFRMEGQKGSTPTGTLVIRVDGRWVEPEFSSGVKLITK